MDAVCVIWYEANSATCVIISAHVLPGWAHISGVPKRQQRYRENGKKIKARS